METIYTQKHNNFTLSLVRTLDKNNYIWQTVITNKNRGEKLVLNADSADRSKWSYKESIGESPVELYNIIHSILNDKILYVFYDKFGSILMAQYHFTGGTDFDKKETLIGAYLSSGGFGSHESNFRYMKFNNKIYFILSARQQFLDKNEGFYSLDLTTSRLKKIVFTNNSRVFVATYVKHKDALDDLAYSFLSEEDLARINRTKMFMEKPYYLYEVNNDIEQRKKEINDLLLSVWLFEKYPFFGNNNHENDDSSYKNPLNGKEKKTVEKYIKEIFEFTGNTVDKKFEVFDCLYTGTPDYIDTYYFFYLDINNHVNIVRYNIYDALWYFGDFDEIALKPQIDIYKSK